LRGVARSPSPRPQRAAEMVAAVMMPREIDTYFFMVTYLRVHPSPPSPCPA
jgi:hypothetical protein